MCSIIRAFYFTNNRRLKFFFLTENVISINKGGRDEEKDYEYEDYSKNFVFMGLIFV